MQWSINYFSCQSNLSLMTSNVYLLLKVVTEAISKIKALHVLVYHNKNAIKKKAHRNFSSSETNEYRYIFKTKQNNKNNFSLCLR